MHKSRSAIWISALANLVLFTVFFSVFYPVYNSIEDVNILYLLSGGYGQPPTQMAHYNHIIHPLLGWAIKSLFLITGKFNWYSLAMIAAHYLSFTVILAAVIRGKNKLISYAVYAALFIVFEGYFLLYPDFTSASIALTSAGFLLLLSESWQGKGNLNYRHCIAASLLFLLASFYRIHSMIPLLGIALPFFAFTTSKKNLLRSSMVVAVSGICILLFNLAHQSYYKAQKPDWPQEEAYRQKIFRFFNEAGSIKIPPADQKWHTEYQVATRGVIMDTSSLPSSSLDSMYHELKTGHIKWDLPPGWLKWFWINNRLFFFLAIFIFALFGLRRRILPAAIISAAFVIGGFSYLLFTAKAPPYILISSLSLFCFALFFYGKEYFPEEKRMYKTIALAGAFLFICWGTIRLYRTSKQNKNSTILFKRQYAEIAAHPDRLFILVSDFNIHHFYVLNTPEQFRLPNYLNSEHFISNNYQAAMKRFELYSLKDFFSSPAILFWGKPSDELKSYFEKIAGRPLLFIGPLPEFSQGSVWRIEAAN